jgi:putative transposase
VQYASRPYQAVLERHGVQSSMSRRGNCLDNAPMESFFASLKTERVHEAQFRTRTEARAAVFEYIDAFYNRQRLHSALSYRTPAEARASMEAITMRKVALYSDLPLHSQGEAHRPSRLRISCLGRT